MGNGLGEELIERIREQSGTVWDGPYHDEKYSEEDGLEPVIHDTQYRRAKKSLKYYYNLNNIQIVST